jgi:hypothetical protein
MKIFTKANRNYFFLLFLLALGWLTACSSPAQLANPVKEPTAPPDRVDVVYFNDSEICHCQIAPGERIQSTLFIIYGGDLASGKLTYQSIDLNNANNAAIINKYGATSQSLFINVVRGDTEQITAVPEILLVKDDNEALDRLVINRISRYLPGEE